MTFMKTFWAALLACVVSGIILTLMSFLFLASMAAVFSEPPAVVKTNSVLKIDLTSRITDAPNSPLAFGLTGVTFNRTNTMLQVIAAIEKAAADNNIKGIYIDLTDAAPVNIANVEEIRKAILQFKQSGKFVVSYGDSYSQLGYYLSSVADVVLLNPVGDMDWRGMSMSVMFYKGLLDKLGVKPEIIRHGSFKSAVEPYMLTSMSPENRLQYTTLVESIWGAILEDVSSSRGIDQATLSGYASDLTIRSASDARDYGFVDALVYRDQAHWFIGELVKGASTEGTLSQLRAMGLETGKVEKKQRHEYVSLAEYISSGVSLGRRTSKNKIALIYAEGGIVDSGGDGDVVGRDVAAKLARARQDEKTKAVVLRVNSPGGSALASELIWREMELTRAVKPVIVSMGMYAASGGYYISCPADIILTDRTTLTGSIGVFGILFDISGAMKDKLGITVDIVRTNPSADLGSIYRGVTPVEREAIQQMIEEIYDTFVNHVADGRNMTWDEVDNIGGGRVWTGADALGIGLVDGIGGLRDALSLAADRGGIADDFRVWQVIEQPDPIAVLLQQLGGARAASIKEELGDMYMEYKAVKDMLDQETLQARMPYNFVIE
ncbi:MAG: signal peptide peptidase SppA [Rikenellaceae bacterium]|nr:signal peptide peptidase SppA [Rikenellaceae bacterium]